MKSFLGSTNSGTEKALFAGDYNEGQTAILPAVLLDLSVQNNENYVSRCNLIEIPCSSSNLTLIPCTEAIVNNKQSRPAASSTNVPVFLPSNVMSLVPKIDEVCVVTNTISPDFISITETWHQGHVHSNVVELNGYDLERKDRQSGQLTFSLHCTVFMYKVLNDHAAPNLKQSFHQRNLTQNTYNLRNSEFGLSIPKPRTEYLRRSYAPCYGMTFHKQLDRLATLRSFKKRHQILNYVKSYLIVTRNIF